MVTGTWNLTVAAPVGEIHSTVKLWEEDGKWFGHVKDDQGQESDLQAVKVEGNNAKFKMQSKTPFGMTTLKADLTFSDDACEGSVSFLMGKLKAKGVKVD